MTERIRLVQGDTRPQIVVQITDQSNTPINCLGSTVKLYFRRKGGARLTVIPGVLLPGRTNADGTVTNVAPYAAAGSGGRVSFVWPSETLQVAPGLYEGEVEVTFEDGTVQTVYETIPFKLRAQF